MPFAYTVFPVDLVSSVVMSGVVLFCLMLWTGVMYYDVEDDTAEQVSVLKLSFGMTKKTEYSITLYYASKLYFLFLLGIVMGAIGVLVPFTDNVLHGGIMFTRKVIGTDIVVSALFHLVIAFTGAVTSGMFHKRLLSKRKQAFLLCGITALLAVIKNGIMEDFPVSRFILWIIPPVSEAARKLSVSGYFQAKETAEGLLYLIGYSIILAVVWLFLIRRKKLQ